MKYPDLNNTFYVVGIGVIEIVWPSFNAKCQQYLCLCNSSRIDKSILQLVGSLHFFSRLNPAG